MTGRGKASAKYAPASPLPLEIDKADSHISSAPTTTASMTSFSKRKEPSRFARPSLPSGSSFDWKRLDLGLWIESNLPACARPGSRRTPPATIHWRQGPNPRRSSAALTARGPSTGRVSRRPFYETWRGVSLSLAWESASLQTLSQTRFAPIAGWRRWR